MRKFWMVCIIGLLWMGGARLGLAQSTADAYFHQAAKAYVAGNSEVAMKTVEEGLEIAPSDPKLLALRKKLQRPGRSRGQGSSSQAGNSSENGAQSRSDRASSGSDEEGSESASSSQPETQTSEARRSPSGSERAGSRRGRATDSGHENAASGSRRLERSVDTLSRAQAERLLRALESQERRLLQDLNRRSGEPRTVEKDW